MQLTDPRTATAIAVDKPVAGVAAEEHVNGGGTTISCYTDGVFEAYSSGSIAIGDPIVADSNNYIKTMPSGTGQVLAASLALICGRALEAGTGPAVINVRIGPL